MLEINKIYNCNCIDGLKQLDNESVNLTVTSCPYDNLREYHGVINEDTWNFEVFKPIAQELYRVTKKGGVVVWVVGDAVVNGGETGSSFKQALYFQECGFKIHDTMIYEKNSSTFPARADAKRYSQIFEYMFVFVKGKIRNDIKLIADKKNKWFGWTNWGQHTQYDVEGNLVKAKNVRPIPEFSLRTNIWKYSVSFNDKTGHPAVFPEKLAEDNILSWSVEGDLVLDPFMGSGTTAKMAMLNKRNYIGFELNKDYYEKSLERVAKYDGKVNEQQYNDVTVKEGDEKLGLKFAVEDDNELDEKTKLFGNLVDELNTYFNEQSLGILKTLKLTFVSKTNEKRVENLFSNNNKESKMTDEVGNREPNFKIDDEVYGKFGENDFTQWCADKGFQVKDVSKDLVYQLSDIDFLISKNQDDLNSINDRELLFSRNWADRKVFKYEVKTDTRSFETRNVVFEVISHDFAGCMASSKADFIYYVFVDDSTGEVVKKEVWTIKLSEWRKYIRESLFTTKDLKEVEDKYGIRMNNFNTNGDCVANFLCNIEKLQENKIANRIF